MYWSVHQYHNPMMGAQRSMPGHGKLPLKYHAIRSGSSTGAQVPAMPSGMIGFHRLKRSGSSAALSPPQPPRWDSPNQVSSPEPTIRTSVCSASVYATARMPPATVYMPVSTITTREPTQKLLRAQGPSWSCTSGSSVANTIPPAKIPTAILVST